MIAPAPDLTALPRAWAPLTLLAATVYLEAEGEPDAGKVAVAWVIRNRMAQMHKGVADIVLAPWQFSCFNSAEWPQHKARLAALGPETWDACYRAACAALWALLPDPTKGAQHYLNPEATRAGRPNHDLPNWYERTKVTAEIGRHHFLRL